MKLHLDAPTLESLKEHSVVRTGDHLSTFRHSILDIQVFEAKYLPRGVSGVVVNDDGTLVMLVNEHWYYKRIADLLRVRLESPR